MCIYLSPWAVVVVFKRVVASSYEIRVSRARIPFTRSTQWIDSASGKQGLRECQLQPSTMRSKATSATATLVLACAACEAFHVPASTARGTRTSMRSARRLRASTEAASGLDATEVDDGTGALSSYPGPMIPRVGGKMPEQRPGWFRVPAPGGQHTKVCAHWVVWELV